MPSTVPVTGESFCECEGQEELSPGFGVSTDCLCGEEDEGEQQLINTVLHHMSTAGYTVTWRKHGVEAGQTEIRLWQCNESARDD